MAEVTDDNEYCWQPITDYQSQSTQISAEGSDHSGSLVRMHES